MQNTFSFRNNAMNNCSIFPGKSTQDCLTHSPTKMSARTFRLASNAALNPHHSDYKLAVYIAATSTRLNSLRTGNC